MLNHLSTKEANPARGLKSHHSYKLVRGRLSSRLSMGREIIPDAALIA